MEVRHAQSDDEIRSCHPVMRQLRADYGADELVTKVRRQEPDGYRLAMLVDDGAVVAVAGYRIAENLAWGKYLYVDDLVTDDARRSKGYGQHLLAAVEGIAREAGCDELHLDSGVQRFAAHRFYLRYGMDIKSHHFSMDLREPRRTPE
jgi:GNAT superfamily N-acetyltransferase